MDLMTAFPLQAIRLCICLSFEMVSLRTKESQIYYTIQVGIINALSTYNDGTWTNGNNYNPRKRHDTFIVLEKFKVYLCEAQLYFGLFNKITKSKTVKTHNVYDRMKGSTDKLE